MWTWVALCLCVAYVTGQVIVPPLSPENQQATEDHLAALTRATKAHIEAHKNLPPNDEFDDGRHQHFAPQSRQHHQPSFASQSHQPSFAPQSHQPSFSHERQHHQQSFAPQSRQQSFSQHDNSFAQQSFSQPRQQQRPAISEAQQLKELQQATKEHLEAVARATQLHFAAHKEGPSDDGQQGGHRSQSFAPQRPSFAPQQTQQQPSFPFSGQSFAPQGNSLPFGRQSGGGFSAFNPHTFGQGGRF